MTEKYKFNDKELPVGGLFNEQQLLDFALHYMSIQNSEDEPHPIAIYIIISYILREYKKQNKENFTEEEIINRMKELITNYILSDLVEKGYVEVDFNSNGEISYRKTDKLEEVVNGHKNG